MTNETLTLEKAMLYKTAYSPLFKEYVKILSVYQNGDRIIFKTLMENNEMLFHHYELTDFVL